MQAVALPDGTQLNFPDGMSQGDMASAIYANFPQYQPKRQEQQDLSDQPVQGDAAGSGFSDAAQPPVSPEAGGGRGFVNPPPAVQRPGMLANAGGSAAAGGFEMAKAAGVATFAPAKAIDFVHSLITGNEETGAVDWAGRKFIDPNQRAIDFWSPKPEEQGGVIDKVVSGLARMAPALGTALLTGSASEAPAAAMGLAAVKQAIANGMRSMSVPAFSSGIAKSADLIEKGAPLQEAVQAGLTEGMTSDITGGLAMSTPGANIATRAAQGAAVGATTGEVSRQAQNIAAPDFQSERTPEGLAVSALTGAVLGAGTPHGAAPRFDARSTAPHDVAPEAAAPSPEVAPGRTDPVADIVNAPDLDTAINAAQRAAESPEANLVRAQMQAIRPRAAIPPEIADVRRAAAVPAEITGADQLGSPDAARGVADGDGGNAESAPAVAAEPAADRAESGPVPSRAANAVAREFLDAVDSGGIPLNPAKIRSIAEGLGLEVSRSAAPEQTVARIRSAVDRAEQTAVGELTATTNPSGTLTVRGGDPKGVLKLLKDAGITSAIPSRDGVVVGRSQAEAAQRVVADFQYPEKVESAPAQEAAIQSLGATGTAPAGGRTARSAAWDRNPFKVFLAQHGISSNLTSEFAPGETERRLAMVPGYGPIFKKTGKQLDDLAQLAVEQGFMVEPDDVQLHQMITAALGGKRIIPQYAEGAAELEAQRRMQDHIDQHQELSDLVPDDLRNEGYDRGDPELQARVRELIAQSEKSGVDHEGILEDVARRHENATTDEYHSAARQALEAALARQGESGAQDRSRATAAQDAEPAQAAAGVARDLLGPAPNESQQRAASVLGERASLDRQQQANAPSGAEFRLTGSSRPTDEAAARGQEPLFSRSGVSSKNAFPETIPWTRAEYESVVRHLPDDIRNDPRRRSPLPAEGGNLRAPAELRTAVEEVNSRFRDENEALAKRGFGPVALDERGNLIVDAREVGTSAVLDRLVPLADKLDLGLYVKGVPAASIGRLNESGFEGESGLGVIASRGAGTHKTPRPEFTYSPHAIDPAGTVMSRKPRGFAEIMFKRGDETSYGGITEPDFHAAISKAFGEGVSQRLIDNGVVIPLADQSHLPDHVVPFASDGRTVYGFHDPNTNHTYAVLANLKPEMIRGLVLHEVGVHYGFEAMLGRDKYAQIIDRISVMGRSGNKAVIEARDQARRNAAVESQIPEETLAYLVGNHGELGVVRETVARIKAFLFNKFGIGGKSLGVDDITALARAAVLHASRTQPGTRTPDFASVSFSRAESPEEKDLQRSEEAGPRAEVMHAASDWWSDVRNDLMMKVMPMSATGNRQAQASAQKFANAIRLARQQWSRLHFYLTKNFTPDERRVMWDAADRENIERMNARDNDKYQRPEGVGLDSLEPKERAAVETLHEMADELWMRAQAVGMVEGEGLPFWTPRMLVTIGEDGEVGRMPSGAGKGARDIGQNLRTSAQSTLHRKYRTAEETEAAGSALAKSKGAEGAQIVRDITTMPLAMSRLERAIAGRELVDTIKAIGQATGQDIIGSRPGDGYTVIDHPAFTTYRPRFVKDDDGKIAAAQDQNGDVVMDGTPMYIRKDWEGPLRAVLSTRDGTLYSGYMLLKSKAMSGIMFSPLMHNMVIWGRALAYSPMKVGTTYLYFKGHALARDPDFVKMAMDAGLVPLGGNRSTMIEATDIAAGLGKPGGWGDPNESWVSLSLQKLGNAIKAGAGDQTKRSLDAVGDFIHHTALWKQVGALQWGIFGDARQWLMDKKGLSEDAANTLAAHWANRYGGAVASENMSELARKAANILLFSRSFTLGNIGAMKDVFTGLPAGLKAQLYSKVPEGEAARAMWIARRKAMQTIAIEVGFRVALTSLAQDLWDHFKKDKSWGDIGHAYLDRLQAMGSRIASKPLSPDSWNPDRLSSTWANEPGKKDRVDLGPNLGDRHEYGRIPTGKVVEDMLGWVHALGGDFTTPWNKMSPILRSSIEAVYGKDSHGTPVRDPDGNLLKSVAQGAAHVAEAQTPWSSITTAYDMLRGKATTLDKEKLAGTVTGFTVSQGHPNGPEGAVNQQSVDRFEQSRRYVMQQVKEDLKDGDEDKARSRMEAIGMTGREISAAINRAIEPRSGISRSARQKFERRATEQEREEMEQQQSR